MGTPAHVPYGGGVDVGTVTGVHNRKSGIIGCDTKTTPGSMRWSATLSSARPKPRTRTSKGPQGQHAHHQTPPNNDNAG